jgi:hypothetical protein
MRLILPAVLICLALCTVAFAKQLLANGDFAVAAGDPTAPAGWVLPVGDRWQRVETGGPRGGPCLHYSAEAGASGPVRQRPDFSMPDTEHEISLMVRAEGGLKPAVAVVDVPNNARLALMQAQGGGSWELLSAKFRTQTADTSVDIYADTAHLTGAGAPAGDVWVADVRLAQAAAGDAAAVPDMGENIALNKPYTMDPAPRYSYSADEGDVVQLTDGEYSEGHFWTRKTTVGWSTKAPVYINIDLGKEYPVKGIGFSTAAGVAEVRWPRAILVFVSDDGQNWYRAGDLVAHHTARQPLPEYGEYAAIRLWTDALRTHGRYVQLYIEPEASYVFCDEIEVYRGEDAWVGLPHDVEPIVDLKDHMSKLMTNSLIQNQFTRDLQAVKDDIADLPAAQGAAFAPKVDALTRAIADMPIVDMDGFKAILPMTDLERDIFRLQAEVWRAQGKPLVRLWDIHRWDPLAPSAEPREDSPEAAVDVRMMSNEFRADVFNITNADDREHRFRLSIGGLPGGDNPDYITVHEALTVGTRRFTEVTAALPEARQTGDEYVVTVPAGMTRQVWFTFNPVDVEPGAYQGAVRVRGLGGVDLQVPVSLRIDPFRFPDETTLLCGGWEYTDSEAMYGITPQNRDAVIKHLQERYVNAPWATGASMGYGEFDGEGNMTVEPDTARFDNWVAQWPDAKMYMVYRAVGAAIDGSEMGTELFNKKVGAWARFWSDHLVEIGLQPNQLGVLIYDEPSRQEQYDIITAWARAMEAAAPGIVTWVDPQPQDDQTPREMFASVDVLCPYRHPFLARPDWYRQLFFDFQQQGKELWFYNADGPARTFDPYSFYLLQEWHAFKIGAKGSNFWAFGDSGRVSCWNEYPAAGNGPYCPSYIDETSITPAKYMEAIREGIQDYEYLTMLQARVVELEGNGVGGDAIARAKDLLATGPDRVMAMEQGANYRWDQHKDRSVADTVRIEILDALVALAELD